ncbi:ATP-binding cassette domain-containing protein [Tamlana fucoidanivorans]|uniref:ABC transporter ATP-binding protein n=1 Tax=Allotamlana fucoidanivorans TaxID=2583814 RepID=UPI001E58D2C7|nr:ATP-binding cassette domain-containing protein [Tamlana fucoidanivorans]
MSNKDNKVEFVKRLVSGAVLPRLKHLKPAIFSEETINKLISEEIRHDIYLVQTQVKNSLLHSSQGERKQALLDYIISKNPEYLIVDNIYDSLDTEAQVQLKHNLTEIANHIPLVQLAVRRSDILPFIETVYRIEGKNRLVELQNESKPTDTSRFRFQIPYSKPENVKKEESLVRFKNVSIKYKERCVLNNISWEIKSGEFWQLIGKNGSGKTTILSLITGENPKAYQQDITLFGFKKGSGESIWDIKKHIGSFSSEYLRGFRRLDSVENMMLSGFYDSIGLYKYPNEREILVAKQWLNILGFYELRKQPFLSLSKGYQRLILIARAMVKQPKLLVLDEPTNDLDDHDATLFCELVNKIASETQTAILYVSHRKEPNLKPQFIYQLTTNTSGSIGSIVNV